MRSVVVISLLLGGSFTALGAPAHAATQYEVGIATTAPLLRLSDKDLRSRLSNIQKLGATWIRVDFSWPAIQPDGPTSYQWTLYDRLVREAGLHNLKILAVLDYTPRWAQDPHCAALIKKAQDAQNCNPRSPAEFAHFAAVASFRYRHQAVRGWEIWNEPNLVAYWKTAQPRGRLFVDPVAYARLANAAAAQISYHDPGSAIITGGLSPLFQPSATTGMRQSDYLAQLLPHLNPKFYTGIGIHPYSWPLLPDKVAIYNAFYTVDNGNPQYDLRTILSKYGWGNKQIWGTEFGASTQGVSHVTKPTLTARPDHVSESVQAQIVQQGISDWYSKPNVGPLFVYSDSDQGAPTIKNKNGFGLERSNGTKKPAYTAFQTATRQLRSRAEASKR